MFDEMHHKSEFEITQLAEGDTLTFETFVNGVPDAVALTRVSRLVIVSSPTRPLELFPVHHNSRVMIPQTTCWAAENMFVETLVSI